MRFKAPLRNGALISALALGLAAVSAPALAAGGGEDVPDHDWSFEGPLGTFDADELQRGWQIYMTVCSGCHSMKYLAYRDLGSPTGPAYPEEQVKAFAAQFQVPDLDENGDPTTRDATPADTFASPFPNEDAARAANGGALPPDLSLITKARSGFHGILKQIRKGAGGPEYLYALLTGYQEEPPEGFEVGPGLQYNKYFPGHQIAMTQPLYGDDVTYQDGTAATLEQEAHDLVAFMTWAAEPNMVERKRSGARNLILLAVFAMLLWFSNKKLWKPVKHGE